MEKLETEVKFYISDIDSIHKRISDLGARSRGRFFERNLRFEDKQRTLKTNKFLLRLRRDKIATLTFKSPLTEGDNEFKKMKELEVEVSDFNTMKNILQSLGFQCEQTYEKWRETLLLDKTQFCLDCMPYGNFLEIEGEGEDIKNYASRLGLRWSKRILLNYLEIFEILKDKTKLDFSDVTFDNFKNIDAGIADYLSIIESYRRLG
jgi:adenylate cyclase, class 2